MFGVKILTSPIPPTVNAGVVTKASPPRLTRRERQILDVVYRLRRATAAEVHRELPDAPTYTTVRGLLRVLESKGHLRHQEQGKRYVYLPSTPREDAGASLLSHVVRTYFDGSPTEAVRALIGAWGELTPTELDRLARLVERARGRRAAIPIDSLGIDANLHSS